MFQTKNEYKIVPENRFFGFKNSVEMKVLKISLLRQKFFCIVGRIPEVLNVFSLKNFVCFRKTAKMSKSFSFMQMKACSTEIPTEIRKVKSF